MKLPKLLILLPFTSLLFGCVATSTITKLNHKTTTAGITTQHTEMLLFEELNWFLSYPPTLREDCFLAKGRLIPEGEDSKYAYFRSESDVRFTSFSPIGAFGLIEQKGKGGIYLSKDGKSNKAGFYMNKENNEIERLMKFDKTFFKMKGLKWDLIEVTEPTD